jgi:ribosomal protein L11 methyltransferase
LPQWWPVSRLTALVAADGNVETLVGAAAARAGRPAPAFETFVVAERDWVRATQAQFAPIRIDDALWIVPTWCSPPDPGAVNVTLDPGLAFGTGTHPTTQLALAWLHARVTPGAAVLDYGCGSGILAIAAAKLGAGRVLGTDIDPQAVRASTDNARVNAVTAAFLFAAALPMETFDIVVSNILANPLRLLAPALAARTAVQGRVALTGILAAQAGDVRAAYARWFDIRVWQRADEWVLLEGTRLPAH